MRSLILFSFIFVKCYVGYCSFLELTDISGDSLPYVWTNLVTPQLLQLTKCTLQSTDGGVTEGVCKSRSQCLLSGGVVSGRCGLLSTCCTYGTSRTTNAKVSYFSSADVTLSESPITFYVIRLNENVCQLRLDFVEFELAPATLLTTTTVYECNTDNFYVTPSSQIPQLCGYNTGQHIYVNMPRELQNISLNVRYTLRSTDPPKWNIKVTQLQCPIVLDKRVLIDNAIADDHAMIAPDGCLQYFTRATGTIKSFGYRADLGAANTYNANQYYAMCFRRTQYICGVQLTSDYLLINQDTATPCRDYLMVPGLDDTIVAGKRICNGFRIDQNPIIRSIAPGPIHIDFYAGANNQLGGFSFDYTMAQCSQS